MGFLFKLAMRDHRGRNTGHNEQYFENGLKKSKKAPLAIFIIMPLVCYSGDCLTGNTCLLVLNSCLQQSATAEMDKVVSQTLVTKPSIHFFFST